MYIFLPTSTNIPNHVKSKLLIKSCSNYITFCPSPMHWLVLNRIIPTGFMQDKWYYKKVTPHRTMECDLLQPTRVFMKVGCVWGSVCIDNFMYMVKKWMTSHFPSFGGSIRPQNLELKLYMGVELYSCTISFDPGGTCIFSPLSCSSVCILVFWHLNDGENDHYNLSLQLENSHGFPHGSIQLYEHQPSKPEDRNGVVSQVFFSHCQQKKQLGPGST